jgi:alpha-beta hydrolase superfamily lysophospholipase
MIYPELAYYFGHHGDRLAARVWRTESAIADVIYLHGIVSHGGWYESSCGHLAANGFQVHFLERRGSGLNLNPRGDVDHWSTWIADVVRYLDQLRGDRPKILLGISWGGILATAIARQHPGLLSGFGLICPGLFSHKAATNVQRMAVRTARLLGLGNQRVAIPLQDPALFTNSPYWQRYIASDPIALRDITIRFAVNNLALCEYATESPQSITVPVFLAIANADPITDNEATLRFVDDIASQNKTVVQYHNASHTLEFEDDTSRYFADLSQWCSTTHHILR